MKVVRSDEPQVLAANFELASHLRTGRLGRILEVHGQLPSTNDRAKELAKKGAEHGLVVVAFTQTAGRGQRGAAWHSPPGVGLYASVLVRPALAPRMAPALTIVAGVALHRAVQHLGPTSCALKWPNDLLATLPAVHGRKLAGILVEASVDAFEIAHAVIGVGVNLARAERPPPLTNTAASLEELFLDVPDHAELLAAFLLELEQSLTLVEHHGMGPLSEDWNRRAYGLGRTGHVVVDQKEVRGEILGIAEDGALRVETADGIKELHRGSLFFDPA